MTKRTPNHNIIAKWEILWNLMYVFVRTGVCMEHPVV